MNYSGKLRKNFGRAVRRRRIEQGLSRETLAYAAGLARNYVGEVERGEKSPTLDVIEAIANALGCEPHTLIKQAEA